MKICGIWGPKGGIGKTTVALNICGDLMFRDPTLNVVLFDADPQGSALKRASKGNFPFQVIPGQPKKGNIPPDTDFLIVDYPPRFETMPKCKRVVIPLSASILDADSVDDAWKALKKDNRSILFCGVKVEKGDPDNEELIELIESYGQKEVPLVYHRRMYKRILKEGMTVFQKKRVRFQPTGPARDEIRNLTDRVFGIK